MRLERRPDATAYQVDDLLAILRSGQLRIPRFQRDMRWRDKDRLDLFDSLYRGFPIGTLLFWKREAEPGPIKFGDFFMNAPARNDALWIVDGQQRVTTLASTLLGSPNAAQRIMHFDLEEEEFRYARVRETSSVPLPGVPSPSTEVPVHELFDSSLLIKWLSQRTKNLPAGFVQRALDCGKRLREYRIPVYVVETEDEDVLRTIFDRTNRTGRRLDDTDVFTALFSTLAPDGEEFDLTRVVRSVASVGFGALKESTVLNALRAIMQLPLDKDFTKALKREAVPKALGRTEAALARAITFLRDDAAIPHSELVPYELPFVVLARFFDAFPEPSTRSRILLRRWLWRGSLAGQLAGATVSLRRHVEAVVPGEEDSSVQRLLSLNLPDPESAIVSFDTFRFSTARTSLALCGLAALCPRDLRTGSELDVRTLFESKTLPPLPSFIEQDGEGIARSVANRLIHPPIPTREVARCLLAADVETAASHGVSDEARAALAHDEFGVFLASRAKTLHARLGNFFRAQAEFGADDSPSLAALNVPDSP